MSQIILLSTTLSDRPNGSMVRYGAMVRDALEQHTSFDVEELYLSPTQAWLDRFPAGLQAPLRQVRTKFHLVHPWYIPIKLIGEIRAIFMGIFLYRLESKLLDHSDGKNKQKTSDVSMKIKQFCAAKTIKLRI